MGRLRERNPSLWVATSEAGAFTPLAGDAHADVVVLGAGITGLTTARLLVEDGASVIVLDAGDLSAGATGYTTAKITSLHGLRYASMADARGDDEARLYGQANEAGISLIADLVERDAIACGFERRRHVVYATEPETVESIAEETEVATRLGLPVDPAPAPALPFATTAAIAFADQAQFHPRRYCLGLAAAIVAAGGRIHTDTRARAIDDDRRVVTDRGQVTGDAVVVATHLPFGELGGYFARATASRSYALAVRMTGARPDDMYLAADGPTRSLRTAGDHLIVGGGGHPVGEHDDTRLAYAELEGWARQHFAVDAIDHRWSAQDWVSGDGLPYIGRVLGHESVFTATAFAKWGMAHGAVAAMVIRDLIAGRDNPWAALYDASRVAPARSAKTVVKEAVGTARHLVIDRVRAEPAAAVDDLGPGQGTVARIDGDPVAVARDDDGTLHAVSAVCTHMGCIVAFNDAERSWDCPCHGSRFTIDGAVLEGPAVDDLAARPAP